MTDDQTPKPEPPPPTPKPEPRPIVERIGLAVLGAIGPVLPRAMRVNPAASVARAMLDAAAEQGLFVLLEAFDAHDLEVAAELAAVRRDRDEQVLMGLNCRDLQTLQIEFARFERLREQLPMAWPAVAESGVITSADAAQVARLGYRLALVGTTLMQRDVHAQAVRELLAAGRGVTR